MRDIGNKILLEDDTGYVILEDDSGDVLLENAPDGEISFNKHLGVSAGSGISVTEKIR